MNFDKQFLILHVREIKVVYRQQLPQKQFDDLPVIKDQWNFFNLKLVKSSNHRVKASLNPTL